MNLIIDQGNTNIKFVLFYKNNIIDKKTYKINKNNINLKVFFSNFIKGKDIIQTIYSSVSGYNKLITELINLKIKKNIFFDNKTLLPIKNLYKTPETLGQDRIAAAVGANFIFPNINILIIDIGTAITYDYVNSNNEYIGGNISPGINIRFKALNKFTKKLPLQKITKINANIGKNTKNAIILGVQKGIFYEINGYLADFQDKYKESKIFLTGGDNFFFDKLLKNTIFANSNLVTIGLNRILNYNV